MPGMTMVAAKAVYEQALKPQILKAFQDALTATFGGNNNEVAQAMALQFATKAAEGITGPICQTIVDIVSQAQIISPAGILPGTFVGVGSGTTTTPIAPGLLELK